MIKEIKELESKLVCRFPELADMSRILSKWITEELLVRLKLRIEELKEYKRLHEGESQAHFNCVSENSDLMLRIEKLEKEAKE